MGRGTKHCLMLWLALVLALSGCTPVRRALGAPPPGDPSVAINPAETRWLLIKNPRFGDVPSEPEYIWVEEDKIPFTFTGLIKKNRSEEHTSELQSRLHLVCRLLLEKKKQTRTKNC